MCSKQRVQNKQSKLGEKHEPKKPPGADTHGRYIRTTCRREKHPLHVRERLKPQWTCTQDDMLRMNNRLAEVVKRLRAQKLGTQIRQVPSAINFDRQDELVLKNTFLEKAQTDSNMLHRTRGNIFLGELDSRRAVTKEKDRIKDLERGDKLKHRTKGGCHGGTKTHSEPFGLTSREGGRTGTAYAPCYKGTAEKDVNTQKWSHSMRGIGSNKHIARSPWIDCEIRGCDQMLTYSSILPRSIPQSPFSGMNAMEQNTEESHIKVFGSPMRMTRCP